MNFFKKYETLVYFITVLLGLVTFVFQSFATKEFVKEYVDVRHDSVMKTLSEIREDVREIRNNQRHK